MAHSGWTQEPWTYGQDLRDIEVGGERVQASGALTICANDGEVEICTLTGLDQRSVSDGSVYEPRYTPEAWANARRIVAAVNACKGIPTEALEAGVVQEMREALQAMLDAFVWAQDAPPLKNPDGSRTEWQFVATRTLDRVRELLRRSGDPVPDRALARFLGEEAPSGEAAMCTSSVELNHQQRRVQA